MPTNDPRRLLPDRNSELAGRVSPFAPISMLYIGFAPFAQLRRRARSARLPKTPLLLGCRLDATSDLLNFCLYR